MTSNDLVSLAESTDALRVDEYGVVLWFEIVAPLTYTYVVPVGIEINACVVLSE
jgi:hypothetical protein